MSEDVECLGIEVNPNKSKPILVGCVYKSPHSDLIALFFLSAWKEYPRKLTVRKVMLFYLRF